jgi:hypothetical protein
VRHHDGVSETDHGLGVTSVGGKCELSSEAEHDAIG